MIDTIFLNQSKEHNETQQANGRERPLGPARRRKNSRERRDKGKKLIKPRDLLVPLWIAQQYAARLDQVQELLSRRPGRGGKTVSPAGLTLSAVLLVPDRWVALSLVEYRRIYAGEPGWVWLTPHGLSLLQLPYARLAPKESTFPHLYHINRVRLELERRHPEYRWVSERTLRAAQPRRDEGASVPHARCLRLHPETGRGRSGAVPKIVQRIGWDFHTTPHCRNAAGGGRGSARLHHPLVLRLIQDARIHRGGAQPLARELPAAR